MTVTEFLLARIEEDETEARFAMRTRETPARFADHWEAVINSTREVVVISAAQVAPLVATMSRPFGAHVARWDPARVLAECQAKRRIVQALGLFDDRYIWSSHTASYAEDALLALAAIYSDHPDYDPEWAV